MSMLLLLAESKGVVFSSVSLGTMKFSYPHSVNILRGGWDSASGSKIT